MSNTDSLFIVMFKGSLVGERLLNQHNNFYLLFIIFYRIYQNINESKHFLNGVNGGQNLMHFPIQLLSVGVVEILRYHILLWPTDPGGRTLFFIGGSILFGRVTSVSDVNVLDRQLFVDDVCRVPSFSLYSGMPIVNPRLPTLIKAKSEREKKSE